MSEQVYYNPINGNYYPEYDLEDEDVQWKEGTNLWECKIADLPKIDLVDIVYNHVDEYLEIDDDLPNYKEIEKIDTQLNEYLKTNFKYYKENKNKVIKFKDGQWIEVV